MSTTKTRPSNSSQTSTNLVAHAVSGGTSQKVRVTDEQAASVCNLVNAAKPATPELRAAAARARQFKFVAR